jgi:hypothetical protein
MINGVEENSENNSDNNSSNNSSNDIHNLLMIDGVEENNNNNIIIHVMYIKDIQKYTKLHICQKCGYIPPATNNGSYHTERFEEHIQSCEGTIKRSLCLNEQSISFIPHIQKNPVYNYSLAHNRRREYRVIEEYTTFDFETVMKKEIQKITDKTSSYNNNNLYLLPTMLTKTSKFLYRKTDTNESFINNWLNSLSTDAQKIFESQVAYYDSLNLLQYILNRLSFIKRINTIFL